jgi:guanosine-3',5'-bis(diphosphate) 3'-pyrophosphohydrolase
MIDKAIAFATAAHEGQKRKFTGEPYIVHPLRVMSIVSTVPRVTPEMVAAAVLHDVLEDTQTDLAELRRRFDHEVVQMVVELTTPSAIRSIIDRGEKTKAEAARLGRTRRQTQTIKFADIIDNASNLWERDAKFAAVYLPEKMLALEAMREGNYDLWARATALCTKGPTA